MIHCGQNVSVSKYSDLHLVYLKMTMDEWVEDLQSRDETQKAWSISVHAFSDLSHVSPLMFLYLLKESYICGELKASAKFRRLQEQAFCWGGLGASDLKKDQWYNILISLAVIFELSAP